MGKRKVLTLFDKQQMIKRIDEGASQAAIAREYGIGRSTVSEIYKVQRNKIEEFLGTEIYSPVGLMRKKMRKADREAVETAVFAWFKDQCSKGVVVSGPDLAQKAVMFDKKINGDNSTFSASTGWLRRFKDRHGIREFTVSGEYLSILTKQSMKPFQFPMRMEGSETSETSGVATEQDHSVEVTYGDFTWNLSFVWLRDHCRCEECYDQVNCQRLVDTVSIPLDIRPVEVTCGANSFNLTWPDGHLTHLPWQWLMEYGPGVKRKPTSDTTPQRILWDGDKLRSMLPPDIPFKEFLETETGLKEAVERFYKWGVVFINGSQPNTEDVEKTANRFSRVQETYYGRVCVVKSVNEFADVGYSNAGLKCHTDTTYFHEPSGGLLFSCFEHDGEGGDNPLVDGFYAAAKLKQEHPEHYEALSTLPLAMHYVDKERHIETHATTIKNDPITGDIEMIRFNNNDRAPISHLSPEDIDRFYAANHAFAMILRSSSSKVVVKLTPGRLMLIDNWRLLHGRIAFTGNRVMTSCYVQRDEINSKIRTMLGVKGQTVQANFSQI